MSQNLYNVSILIVLIAMAIALFSLKYEYEHFRKDVIRLLGALGIGVVNNSKGMTIKVEERKINERIH